MVSSEEGGVISKGDQTRERILREAAVIFNQRGYEGCSLKEIMAATGLEKGGIYRHFANKEELAAEAFDFAWRSTSARRRAGLSEIENHADRLRRYVANFLETPGFPGGCPLLNTAVDSDNGNPILRQRVRAALAEWQAMIISILDAGIRAGTIRAAIDTRAAANRIIGSLEGAMLLSRIEGRGNPLQAALRELDNFIETELRARVI
ncbi:MAG TPA: TetR/AcrR family transcriptional regulator [Acidobacteriaceae bacterium]